MIPQETTCDVCGNVAEDQGYMSNHGRRNEAVAREFRCTTCPAGGAILIASKSGEERSRTGPVFDSQYVSAARLLALDDTDHDVEEVRA